MIRTSVFLCAIAAATSVATAAPTTWEIDVPWDFYTASIPAETNLRGTITWDADISTYYPASWSFTLEHHHAPFLPHYPLTIEGSYPNLSDASGVAWDFRADTYTMIRLSFGFSGSIVPVLVNGTAPSVTFAASEYVQRGPISSQRLIYAGTANLVPAPSSVLALAGLPLLGARRRRR